MTLSPQTLLYEREMARECAVQREVAISLMRFSPDLALLDEATIVVEVGASLRLFGGMLSLCRQARALLGTLGLSARIGVAPTGYGAALLATQRARRVLQFASLERVLSPLPLQAIAACRPFADWFAGLGCDTLADLRRLPRAGLLRRCGETLLDSLDRAFGTAPELFDWFELPPFFSARVELPDRIEDASHALFAAHRLLVQLCGWLCAKQLAVSAFTLSIEHERGRAALPPTTLDIALADPTWREAHLLRLLTERLHRLALPAPALALRLDAVRFAPAEPATQTLFPQPGASPQDHARLLELLIARLGEENVLRPAPLADHRPEVANRWVPVHQAVKADGLPQTLPRPTWMLAEPLRLLMRDDRPFYGSSLRVVSPAERIEAGWFDGQLVTRDYFVAQADDRSYYWIYRERVSSRDAENAPRWFLHGLFG